MYTHEIHQIFVKLSLNISLKPNNNILFKGTTIYSKMIETSLYETLENFITNVWECGVESLGDHFIRCKDILTPVETITVCDLSASCSLGCCFSAAPSYNIIYSLPQEIALSTLKEEFKLQSYILLSSFIHSLWKVCSFGILGQTNETLEQKELDCWFFRFKRNNSLFLPVAD